MRSAGQSITCNASDRLAKTLILEDPASLRRALVDYGTPPELEFGFRG